MFAQCTTIGGNGSPTPALNLNETFDVIKSIIQIAKKNDLLVPSENSLTFSKQWDQLKKAISALSIQNDEEFTNPTRSGALTELIGRINQAATSIRAGSTSIENQVKQYETDVGNFVSNQAGQDLDAGFKKLKDATDPISKLQVDQINTANQFASNFLQLQKNFNHVTKQLDLEKLEENPLLFRSVFVQYDPCFCDLENLWSINPERVQEIDAAHTHRLELAAKRMSDFYFGRQKELQQERSLQAQRDREEHLIQAQRDRTSELEKIVDDVRRFEADAIRRLEQK